MSRILFVLLVLIIPCISLPSYVFAQADESSPPALSTEKERFIVARAAILSSVAITAWGLTNWDWCSNEPQLASEGWLTNASKTGGSDKTGHMFFTYALADLMNWEFKRNGMEKERAARAAALTALGVMTLLEIGDSTSGYGFSYEDLIMDSLGAGVSYLLNTNPSLDAKLDFRVEYWPSKGLSDRDDYAADYSGMKHLFAIKCSGFESLKDSLAKYLEFHIGYYTRGYRSYDVGHYIPERHLYVAIGISMPQVFDKLPYVSKFFEYYQPPNTYLSRDVTN